MSNWQQKQSLIAWAITAIVIITVLSIALAPVVEAWGRYADALERNGRILDNLQYLHQSRAEIEAASAEYHQRNLGKWVYNDSSGGDQASLAIQKVVSSTIAEANGQVLSISALRPEAGEQYIKTGVKVDFSGGVVEVMQILQSLQDVRPLLLLEDLSFRPQAMRRSRDGTGAQQTLAVKMSVVSHVPIPEVLP